MKIFKIYPLPEISEIFIYIKVQKYLVKSNAVMAIIIFQWTASISIKQHLLSNVIYMKQLSRLLDCTMLYIYYKWLLTKIFVIVR